MGDSESTIALNFLEITPKSFDLRIYKQRVSKMDAESAAACYKRNLRSQDSSETEARFAIEFEQRDGFEEEIFTSKFDIDLTKRYLLHVLQKNLELRGIKTISGFDKYRRVYLPLKTWTEGIQAVWMEPYFLAQTESFGFLVDFKFRVDPEYKAKIATTSDRRIQVLSGTLDDKGFANKAFYQFKYDKLQVFFEYYLSRFHEIEFGRSTFTISNKLTELEAASLATKTYEFADGKTNASPYLGLLKAKPFSKPQVITDYLFLFRESDRSFAINLLKGLRGELSPNTFPGIEKLFDIPFNNSCIRGKKVPEITLGVLEDIAEEIKSDRTAGKNTLPIVLTRSKLTPADDELYYLIKHTFTKSNIACQVVTKDLIVNSNALKYSLSNIGLQIFAKAGGKPWIVKPALSHCLIVGIGNKNKEVFIADETGYTKKTIEKFLTYSVLTDSSGLFKEIQILSEADNENDYYKKLVQKLKSILHQAHESGYRDVVIHAPFRISRPKVWDLVFADLPEGLNVSVLVISNDHKFFGYDFSKNALVPFESSYIQISKHEYLVWFEGLQYHSSVFSKRIGGPIYINVWHANDRNLQFDPIYRKRLLQDCINLSGANWRGFKAKQLPVSIFYCQKIADFLKKFDDYGLGHIEFENLKPWFL